MDTQYVMYVDQQQRLVELKSPKMIAEMQWKMAVMTPHGDSQGTKTLTHIWGKRHTQGEVEGKPNTNKSRFKELK